VTITQTEGRVARRQRKNREALILAGRAVMAEKGIDAATMLEVAKRADVGAGTVYSYFKSKDDLAVAVLERLMYDLALKIEKITNEFDDPEQVYAFGMRSVINAATGDTTWKQLLNRSEVISEAIFRMMGPFAIRDLENATNMGRFQVDDASLTWRMSCHAIVGLSLAITRKEISASVIEDAMVRLLCMTGIGEQQAKELAARPYPPLPVS